MVSWSWSATSLRLLGQTYGKPNMDNQKPHHTKTDKTTQGPHSGYKVKVELKVSRVLLLYERCIYLCISLCISSFYHSIYACILTIWSLYLSAHPEFWICDMYDIVMIFYFAGLCCGLICWIYNSVMLSLCFWVHSLVCCFVFQSWGPLEPKVSFSRDLGAPSFKQL